MAKYNYTKITEELLRGGAQIAPENFAQGQLITKSKEEQANFLFSALKDFGANKKYEKFISALEQYMLSNGTSQETIDGITNAAKGIEIGSFENKSQEGKLQASQGRTMELPPEKAELVTPEIPQLEIHSVRGVITNPSQTLTRVTPESPILSDTIINDGKGGKLADSEQAAGILTQAADNLVRKGTARKISLPQKGTLKMVAAKQQSMQKFTLSTRKNPELSVSILEANLAEGGDAGELSLSSGTLTRAASLDPEKFVMVNSPYDKGKSPDAFMSILHKGEGLGQELSKDSISFARSDSELDPITEAIRAEILLKQQQLLQKEILASLESEQEKEQIAALKNEKLREYLNSDKGKEYTAKVFKNKSTRDQLNEIENTGYAKVHGNPEHGFSDVSWAAPAPQSKSRSTTVKNDSGEAIATIRETTHDTNPISARLEDGTHKAITNYRTIDFPPKLETGKGPLHLAMALKDENGRNVPEKNAVYFTAHYDKTGKLTEVSSPVPVKFMGKDDSAVGYIERNGKIFTLPVTQGKYKEMMREIARTSKGVDLSQTVEPPTQKPQIAAEITVETGATAGHMAGKLKPRANRGAITESITRLDQASPVLHQSVHMSADGKILPPAPQKPKSPSTIVLTGGKDTHAGQIDAISKGKKPEEVLGILKEHIAQGKYAVAEAIVNSTKTDRAERPPNVPTLSKEQFKEAYDHGMSLASKNKDPVKVSNIQNSCAKVREVAGVDMNNHAAMVKHNLNNTQGIRSVR